jgi:tocopherol O-methyltransferase
VEADVRAQSQSEINRAVEKYYDRTIELYENLWGEHVHHGYWESGESPADDGADRHTATTRLVRKLAEFAGVPAGARVLDVGCGIGGPALYLAGEHGCTIEGVTLSAAQAARAGEKAQAAGLADRARFHQLDALHTGYPDDSFDLVWALEVLEHIPDRAAFYREALRMLRPGGRLAVATWCLRDGASTPAEDDLLTRIREYQVTPGLISIEAHEAMCRAAGFADVRTLDWSRNVANSWDHRFTRIRTFERGRSFMMDLAREKGHDVLGFFYAGPLMKKAYDIDLMRYGVLRASKPA